MAEKRTDDERIAVIEAQIAELEEGPVAPEAHSPRQETRYFNLLHLLSLLRIAKGK